MFVFQGSNASGYGCFYQTAKTKELDSILGDVHHKVL
eukprot:jgi/Mesen1/8401/ME000468S07829